MEPAETEAGGLFLLLPAGLKLKLPKAPPELESWAAPKGEAPKGVASRFMVPSGKVEAVGDAKVSISSSSSRLFMAVLAGAFALLLVEKGLFPGKVLSAIAEPPLADVECCCPSRNSARWLSRRRRK